MKKFSLRFIFFVLLLIWFAGLSNPVYLDKAPSSLLSLTLNHFYSPLCHQNHVKTFSIRSGKFLVCARCTGIYAGSLIAAFLSLIFKKIKSYFLLPAVLFMLADVLFTSGGIYGYNKGLSFASGLLLGLSLFPYILNILENSLLNETT